MNLIRRILAIPFIMAVGILGASAIFLVKIASLMGVEFDDVLRIKCSDIDDD